MSTEADSEAHEWMTAKQALAILSSDGRSPVEVKAMLADYLRDGQLTARAEAVWLTTEPQLGKAWKSDSATEDVERDLNVPLKYWRTDKYALSDRASWRWPFNKFFYTLSLNPLKRRMFLGVSFKVSDLARLQSSLINDERKPKRGPDPDLSARDAGWLAVVRIALSGNLNKKEFDTQTDLQAGIKTELDDNGSRLGNNKIWQIARQVYPLIKDK